MEFDENKPAEEPEEDVVEIYSKWAILGFSIFPSPLFGGILLMINLWAAGLKKAMYTVLIFVLAYTLIVNALFNSYFPTSKIDVTTLNPGLIRLGVFSLISNVIGGVILSQLFFRRYFPDKDYYPKSIAIPLFIIFLMLLFAMLMKG